MNKKNQIYLVFIFLLFPLSNYAQKECTVSKIYHNYYNEKGSLSGYMFFHSFIECNFAADDPDELLKMKYDTVIEKIDIFLPVLDVSTSHNSQIIEHVYKIIGYLRLRWRKENYFDINWKNYFQNFGLLEGRTIHGTHPHNNYCKVFISFDSIKRNDIISTIEEILDVSGKVCGEIFSGQDGKEVFRIYFDNTVSDTPAELKASHLPRFLID